MINEYNKGGLKMIDLQSFNESLKIKWIKGYLDDNNKGKWKSFVNHYLEKHGGKLVFSANLTLFRLGFFGQSVTGGGSSDPPSVSLEPIMLGS